MANSSQFRFPNLAKEPLVTSRNRGNPDNRLSAKFIDAMIVITMLYPINYFFPKFFYLAVVMLWGLIDALGRGQSPGKWLLGLHTIEIQKGDIPRVSHSFLRNIPFGLISVGVFKGGILMTGIGLLGVLWIALETYFIFSLRSGIRSADILAYTRVFDYKDEHTLFIEQFLRKDDSH